MADTELRYLEGSSALSRHMRTLSGRQPNAAQVAFCQSCLLHGRLFWDSAAAAPLETKPLLLYYGAAAFAKGLVIAAKGRPIQEIPRSHGLKCAPGGGELIGNFTMAADGTGLFQAFNDVAANLNRLRVYVGSNTKITAYPTAPSSRLPRWSISLKDCLARIPEIAAAYELSTGERSALVPLVVQGPRNEEGEAYEIRIDDPVAFRDVNHLRTIVDSYRTRIPALRRWRLSSATRAWDGTVLQFVNVEVPDNEWEPTEETPTSVAFTTGTARFNAAESFPPMAGGYSGTAGVAYLEQVAGEDISEFTLTFAALLGLSSLVRYHPHVWTACVHRRPVSVRPVDDALLPVIERFLGHVEGSFPQFIADAILQS